MSLRLDHPPECCGRPGKLARREWPTHPQSWMEFYRCPRCGRIMLPYHIEPGPDEEHVRLAGLAFDETVPGTVDFDNLSPRLAAYHQRCVTKYQGRTFCPS